MVDLDRFAVRPMTTIDISYPIGYFVRVSGWSRILTDSRAAAGLGQEEMARRAGTSRPTLSAYERGRKVPGILTVERLLAVAGVRLATEPIVTWRQESAGAGRVCWVPDRLWRLPIGDALTEVVLPVELNWSMPGRRFSLRDRRQRHRLYELVLREGEPADIERWVDGLLLVDGWDELILPRRIRGYWQATADGVLGRRSLGAAS